MREIYIEREREGGMEGGKEGRKGMEGTDGGRMESEGWRDNLTVNGSICHKL